MHNIAITQLAAALSNSGIPFPDMTANQVLLSQEIGELLDAEFAKLGLTLENFTVENITLPATIQEALDKKISVDVIGNLGRYIRYQTAESIPLTAQDEGRFAGIGASLGVGVGVDQAIADAMAGIMQPVAQLAAQPTQDAQTTSEDSRTKLVKLKPLLDGGLIVQEGYDRAKTEVLKQLTG